ISFGKPSLVSTAYDPDVLRGYGKRPDNWETTAGLQHELTPGVSLNLTYFHRWFGNFWVNDNLAVAPTDYDPFCIPVPSDPRLPGGGGYQQCGFFDINPSKFGQVQNVVSFAKNYGSIRQYYDGVDLTVNARLPRGAFIGGGLNAGREVYDS